MNISIIKIYKYHQAFSLNISSDGQTLEYSIFLSLSFFKILSKNYSF